MELLYKVLDENGRACHGGKGEWFLPRKKRDGTWTPGKWMPKIENISLCERGYHLCRRQDLIYWLHPTIYEVEYKGKRIDGDNKIVVEQARLTRKLENWNERNARLLAADCVEAVLPIYEKHYPDDKRPRLAIQAARDYADGKIDDAAWTAARDAAWDAAWAAARERQTERLFAYLEGEV